MAAPECDGQVRRGCWLFGLMALPTPSGYGAAIVEPGPLPGERYQHELPTDDA